MYTLWLSTVGKKRGLILPNIVLNMTNVIGNLSDWLARTILMFIEHLLYIFLFHMESNIFFSSKKFTREPLVSLYLHIIFALCKCYSVAHLHVCKWAMSKILKKYLKIEIIKICWNFKFHKAIDEIYSFFFLFFFCYKTKHTYSYNRMTYLSEMMRLNVSKIIQNSNLSQKLSKIFDNIKLSAD